MTVGVLIALVFWLALVVFGPWTALAVLPLSLLALGAGVEWSRLGEEVEHG